MLITIKIYVLILATNSRSLLITNIYFIIYKNIYIFHSRIKNNTIKLCNFFGKLTSLNKKSKREVGKRTEYWKQHAQLIWQRLLKRKRGTWCTMCYWLHRKSARNTYKIKCITFAKLHIRIGLCSVQCAYIGTELQRYQTLSATAEAYLINTCVKAQRRILFSLETILCKLITFYVNYSHFLYII